MAVTKKQLAYELREGGFKKVTGANLSLLPSYTGSGYNAAYKRGGMEYFIATRPEVRQELKGIATRAIFRARGILETIRVAAFSFGDIRDHWVQLDLDTKGDVDYKLILTDTKAGQKGALAIEFGRDEYELQTKNGKFTIGSMTGKFILHRAFGLSPGALAGTGDRS